MIPILTATTSKGTSTSTKKHLLNTRAPGADGGSDCRQSHWLVETLHEPRLGGFRRDARWRLSHFSRSVGEPPQAADDDGTFHDHRARRSAVHRSVLHGAL